MDQYELTSNVDDRNVNLISDKNYQPSDSNSYETDDTFYKWRKKNKYDKKQSFFSIKKHSDVDLEDNLQTNTEAIMNIINNCLGADLLVAAYATSKLGVIGSLIMLTISAYLNNKTLVLLIRCCKTCRIKQDYNNLARKLFGDGGYYMVLSLYFLMGFFQMISFLVACADMLARLLPFALTTTQFRLIAFSICLPATFMRSLKKVAVLSAIANGAAVFMLICMLLLSLNHANLYGFHPSSVKMFPANYGDFAEALPILVITMSIQVGGMIIMSTLQDGSFENIKTISSQSYGIIWILYFLASLPYLVYLGMIQGNIFETFEDNPVSFCARLACLILVILSYMFYGFPCRNALCDLLFGVDEAQYESTWPQFYSITILVNICAIATALMMNDLSMVFEINGTVAANIIAFVLPCMFYLQMKTYLKQRDLMHYRNIPYLMIICIGGYILVSGLNNIGTAAE